MNPEKTGQFICQLRKEKGLTQAALAQRLNLSNRTISKWENGDGMPDISVLPGLADALGVTVDELLRGERKYRPSTDCAKGDIHQKIRNSYQVLSVIALFLALFSAVLGTLTEVYSIYAFRILFYTHWEVLFSAISLGTCVLAAMLYAVGVTRLSMVYPQAERTRLTRRRTWTLILLLYPFPLSFLLRVISVLLPASYLWAEIVALLIVSAIVLIIAHCLINQDKT